MSLLFGNLTQDFVEFEAILEQANNGDPNAIAAVPGSAAHFRHTAALDASYLVYIGASAVPGFAYHTSN